MLEVAVGVDPKFGGKVHVRLESKTGKEIAVYQFQSTGGFETIKPQSIPLTEPPAGRHLLWFVFEGGAGICNFSGFRILP